MSNQTVGTLITSGLILLLPSTAGVSIARRGDGRFLWVAAATALALAVFGLRSLAEGRGVGGFGGVGAVLNGYLLSLVGLLIGIAVCADALVRTRRAKQLAWFAALLALGALPLVASLALFDVTILVLEQVFHHGEPSAFQGERLAFQLLPIGLLSLLAYGVRVALGAWRARRGDLAR
jgi:hypothetical protein